ncbi:extracellular solute-binding protein [Nocardiopsis sp. ATB16-24]|uniref:extracellular solute-binding protein n=1 Tax=Nocardiopsis sp. ATB16-24 TaxID=3019555 RepID=UPI002556E3D4|nr:extracellular solute-binding protein [Nocardiopsis sp. ATB16-24]
MSTRPALPHTLACAALPLLLLGPTACTAPDDQVVRIALAVDVTATEESGEDGVYMRLVQRWEEANEGWRVDVQWLAPEADEQRSQLAVAMQSDDLTYDVLALDNQWVPEFVEREWLLPVDTENELLGWGGFLDRSRDAVCHRDQAWAVPFHMDVGLLYYRADLVDPEEITERTATDGWRGLLELAEEVRDEHGLAHGYTGQFGNYEGLTVNALEFILDDRSGADTGGGGIFHEADEGGDCPVATSASGDFQGLRVLEEGLNPGEEKTGVIPRAALEETEAESLNRFRSGDVVFMRHWPRAVSRLRADAQSDETLQEGLTWVGWGGEAEGDDPAFGVLPLPVAVLGGHSLAVTEESRHPDQAWSLVRSLTGREAQEDLHASGLLPSRGSGYQLESEDPADSEYWTRLRDAVEEGRLRPRTPYYPYVSEVLRHHVHTQLNPFAPDPHPDDMVCELNAALAGRVGSCD